MTVNALLMSPDRTFDRRHLPGRGLALHLIACPTTRWCRSTITNVPMVTGPEVPRGRGRSEPQSQPACDTSPFSNQSR